MEMSLLDEAPFGTLVHWNAQLPIPDGWVFFGRDWAAIATFSDNDTAVQYILIQKLSNLDWIEHLAKKKKLVC